MGIFLGDSGHGPEPSCQISAYYKFFPGFNVFCRISTGLLVNTLSNYCEAIGMFENLFVAKRKNNKRFEKEWLQNRLDV